MRLRDKAIIITLLTWAVVITATYFGGEYTLRNNYLQLEKKTAENDIARVHEIIDNMVSEVNTMNSSWAVWDDAYNFIKNKNQEFIDANMPLSNFTTSKVDSILYFDPSDKLIYETSTNQEKNKIISIPEGMMDYLRPGGVLLSVKNIGDQKSGLISTPSSMYFIASHAVVRGDNSGPVAGTIVMARYFSNNAFEEIIKTSKLNVTFYRLEDISNNKKLMEKLSLLESSADKDLAYDKNEDNLIGYSVIKDVNGKAIALLQVEMARNIYKAGLAAINNFTAIFVAISIVFTLLQIFLLKKVIIDRLERFNREVVSIGESKQFDKRITVTSEDEITTLSRETNSMLDKIQQFNEKQSQLLSKISEAELFLKSIINSMPASLIITNHELQVLMTNSTADKDFSISSPVTSSILDIIPELTGHRSIIDQVFSDSKPGVIHKFSRSNSDGQLRIYSATIFPFSSRDKLFLAFRIDDITDRIKMDERVSQNDKLASLGILTAGVAHEINNPINFVIATVPSLKLNLSEILSVLDEYKKLDVGSLPSNKLDEIANKWQQLDLDYTITETNKLLNAIEEGANRTATIVKDLKVFTRLDEDVMKKANIEMGIDSTLTLLRNSYKNRIEIIKRYGKIPEIDCYPGKLNQVFMNILSNAIDAIPGKGTIEITTKQADDNFVIISFKDTGPGIAKDVQKKIFEPFFTTKDVGKGTGLGLSITFGIIRDHSGTIDVVSEVGKGTEFIITLPIKQHHD